MDDDRSTASHLRRTATVRWADDRWGHPPVRIYVGGWEVGGRLPRGPDADVRSVRSLSAATQTRRKFALEMGRPGHKTDQMGPGRRALRYSVCPFYPKQTGPDRIGSRGGVGLTEGATFSPPAPSIFYLHDRIVGERIGLPVNLKQRKLRVPLIQPRTADVLLTEALVAVPQTQVRGRNI